MSKYNFVRDCGKPVTNGRGLLTNIASWVIAVGIVFTVASFISHFIFS